jgi:hypothetical protein
VHVERDPRIFEAGQPDWIPYFFLFPGPIEKIPPPPSESLAQDWWAWAHEQGAIDAYSTKLSVTLTCHQDVTVAIDALTVRLTEQPDTPHGTLVARPTGGADIVVRGIEVDLDGMGQPVVRLRDSGGGPLPSIGFSVKPGEVERLQIEARAAALRCKWTAELHLLVDGRRQTIEVTDGGKSFETAGTASLEPYIWEGGWRKLDMG